MTKEDKEELLLKDLCARLPYGVHLFTNSKNHIRLLTISHDADYNEQVWINGLYDVDEVKPYLRPLSNMTEEEKKEFHHIASLQRNYIGDDIFYTHWHMFDWLNAHYFDYRGLIPKGLAIEVTEENNPYEV